MNLVNSVIWRLTRKKGVIAKSVFDLAVTYCDAYRDIRSSFRRNGELNVLKTLSGDDFRILFDVGANIGNWTKMAMQYFPLATVHAFEMAPETYKTLLRNIPATSTFVPNNIGLADSDGQMDFKDYGGNSPNNSLITQNEFHDKTHPPTLLRAIVASGDTYCTTRDIRRIDFLKVDVEGAENLVLQGFSRMLNEKRIRCIQFEYGYANGDSKFLLKDFHKLLTEKGYILGKIWSKGVEFSPFRYSMNDFKSGPNYLAVLASEQDMIKRLRYAP